MNIIKHFTKNWDSDHLLMGNRGFLYGEACFTTMRLEGGEIFFEAQHLERLQRDWLSFYPYHDQSYLKSRLKRVFKGIRGGQNGIARVQLFAIDESRSLLRETQDTAPEIICKIDPLVTKDPIEELQITKKIKTRDLRKTPDYLEEIERPRSLFIDEHSHIISSNIGKIYLGKGNEVYVCSHPHSLRSILEEACPFKSLRISLRDLKDFDSCYVGNSVFFLTPVGRIEDIEFKNLSHDKIQENLRNLA